jgi:hypothetical protein
MRTAAFTGKRVPLDNFRGDGPWAFSSPGRVDEYYAVAECYLTKFDCCGYDRTGRNAYSIQVYLDGNRIVRIDRVGHCHMCGGQGADDVLRPLPAPEPGRGSPGGFVCSSAQAETETLGFNRVACYRSKAEVGELPVSRFGA